MSTSSRLDKRRADPSADLTLDELDKLFKGEMHIIADASEAEGKLQCVRHELLKKDDILAVVDSVSMDNEIHNVEVSSCVKMNPKADDNHLAGMNNSCIGNYGTRTTLH